MPNKHVALCETQEDYDCQKCSMYGDCHGSGINHGGDDEGELTHDGLTVRRL